jgi:hypothetical protein
MLQLLDNKLQLEKMIDISDYAGELLSHAQPTPGVLHTSHSLTLRLPQLGAHSSLGVTETPCEPAVQSLTAQPCSRRQTDSLSHLESARVNSHSLSGPVRVTHLPGGQYGCLGCQRVQYDLWHSSLGCSSLCSLDMVVPP